MAMEVKIIDGFLHGRFMKARPRFREGGVETIVDPALEGDYNNEVFTDMTNTAFMCASFSKNDRPAMKVFTYVPHNLRHAVYCWI